MLLTVSSFGECLRRFSPAEAFLSRNFGVFSYEIGEMKAGNTTKNLLPCPSVDSTQIRP